MTSFDDETHANAANMGLGGFTKHISRTSSTEVYLYSGYNSDASRWCEFEVHLITHDEYVVKNSWWDIIWER